LKGAAAQTFVEPERPGVRPGNGCRHDEVLRHLQHAVLLRVSADVYAPRTPAYPGMTPWLSVAGGQATGPDQTEGRQGGGSRPPAAYEARDGVGEVAQSTPFSTSR